MRNRTCAEAGTWDCGYSAPTARMQYTASSFVGPLVELLRSILRPEEHRRTPKGNFPAAASFASHTPDLAGRRLFDPLFLWIQTLAERAQGFQQGRIQTYLLYVYVTLATLLACQWLP